jgi:hypothetical protein
VMILMLPVCSWAAYSIYLNNGSVISGVNSYDESGDEVNIYFDTGSMVVPRKDILKIEGSQTAVKEMPEGRPEAGREKAAPETTAPSASPAPEDDKGARVAALRAELDAVNSAIRSAEERETKLVTQMNEKTSGRFKYNIIQLRQIEKELEPARQELSSVQAEKADLVRKRSDIEAEIKSLE